MITEDYVSFETAKLLKEKGFKPPHDYRKWLPNMYTDNDEIKWGVWSDDWYPRITLQMAMKWLREVHNYNIEIDTIGQKSRNTLSWRSVIYNLEHDIECYHEENFKSYEEACEEAIKYCLKNLI